MTDQEFERLYGRPPRKPGTRKKKKVLWGRVILALIVFILIICGVVQLIKSIVNHFKKEDTLPAVTESKSSVESQPEESSIDVSDASSSEDENKFSGWQFKVCIDPGHGGEDDGACLFDKQTNEVIRKEKDDTLRISLAVKDYLKQQGVQVVMTRETDIMLGSDVNADLQKRCRICNDNKCDLFVSLHRDSVSSDVSGFEAWVHSKKPEMDNALATNIMANLQKAGISENRNIGYGYTNDVNQNYYVNADTVCPSTLVEMGFISSSTDNDLFDKKLNDYAKAIGDAIIKTATDLQIVDSNGKRLLNEQLISRSKLYYPLDYYYTKQQ